MNITLTAKDLRDAISHCIASRDGHNAGFVLLETTDTGLRITSTDTAQWRIDNAVGSVSSEGAVCVTLAMLRSALQGLEGKTNLQASGTHDATLKNGKRQYRLNGIDPNAYPAPDDGVERTAVAGDYKAIADAISCVAYAADKGNVKLFFNGVFIGEDYIAAATGRGGAVSCTDGSMPGIIVPREMVPAVADALRADEAVCYLRKGKSNSKPTGLEVATPTSRYITLLIDAAFPDVKKAMPDPKSLETSATFDSAEMRGAVGRLMPFAEKQLDLGSSKDRRYDIEVEAIGDMLKLTPTKNTSTHDYVKLAEPMKFEPVIINGQMMAGMLSNAGDGNMTWSFDDADGVQAFTVKDRVEQHYMMAIRR